MPLAEPVQLVVLLFFFPLQNSETFPSLRIIKGLTAKTALVNFFSTRTILAKELAVILMLRKVGEKQVLKKFISPIPGHAHHFSVLR